MTTNNTDSSLGKYDGMSEDDIDNMVDMKVEIERQRWLRDIAVNMLDTEVERVRKIQEKAQVQLDESMRRTIKLRETALTEIVRMPVDDNMEATQ